MTECADAPQSMASRYGQLTWLEVPVSDPVRASKFYAEVLGWESSPEGLPPAAGVTGYTKLFFFSKGDLHGAFLLMDKGAQILNSDSADTGKCSVTTTFCVESIEDTLAKVEKNGGKVHFPKTDIGNEMGVFCRFIDSEGNMMGAWAQK